MCTGAPGTSNQPARGRARLTVPVPVLLAIAIGGALGALGRWGVDELIPFEPGGWPWATLVVNVLGALLIGVLASLRILREGPAWLRPLLITGMLGGFTTFSAFAVESGLLIDEARPLAALVYVGATLAAGLVAVRLGAWLVEREGKGS